MKIYESDGPDNDDDTDNEENIDTEMMESNIEENLQNDLQMETSDSNNAFVSLYDSDENMTEEEAERQLNMSFNLDSVLPVRPVPKKPKIICTTCNKSFINIKRHQHYCK